MELFLQSDFRDYYDHMFTRNKKEYNKTLVRMAKTERTRVEDYSILRSYGFITPVLAKGKQEFLNQISRRHEQPGKYADMRDRHVVVYDDLTAHRGEGKRLELWQNVEDDAWIGEYIVASQCGHFLGDESSSWRYLFIGDMVYVLKYNNFSKDWRSNVGQDIEIKLLDVAPRNTTIIKEPLLGIDIVARGGIYYAIDYNDAPGLANSPINYLSADVIIEQLCRWIYKGEKCFTKP